MTAGLAALLVPVSSHKPGYSLGSFGTAIVDGMMSPGEYGSCIGPMQVSANPSGTYTVMFCETNDPVSNYYYVEVSDTATSGGDQLAIYFDNNHDGVVASCSQPTPEDEIIVGGPPPGSFSDFNYCYDAANGAVGSTPDTASPSGGPITGTQNGFGVRKTGGLGSAYEISHPLNSGDIFDYSLYLGSTVGWCLTYNDHDAGKSFDLPTSCHSSGASHGSATGFGDIAIFGLSTVTMTVTDPTTSITLTQQGMGLATTTSTATTVQATTVTTTDSMASTTTSCLPGTTNCTTVTVTNSAISTLNVRSTETITTTQLIRIPTTIVTTETTASTTTFTTTIAVPEFSLLSAVAVASLGFIMLHRLVLSRKRQ